MIWQTLSTSSAETEKLGELLGKQLRGGEAIELRSDLGGGKTTFVKGLARGAGSKAKVVSPTFTLNRIYKAPHFDIHHFDFYRLDDPGILSDQLAESIDNGRVVTVVEWPDKVKNVLPSKHIGVKFQPVAGNSDERQITINYPETLRDMFVKLETGWQESRP